MNATALRVCAQDTQDAFFTEVVEQLARQALQHRAVQHPYLRALGDGTLPDMRWALVDFADHYYGYSAHFPRYLTTVISRLEEPEHRVAMEGEKTALAQEMVALKQLDEALQRETLALQRETVAHEKLAAALETLEAALRRELAFKKEKSA